MSPPSPKNRAKQIVKKWGAIILGVSLTIVSAVISNYFIAKNSDLIAEHEREAANVNQQMEAIWENTRSLERRKDTAIILLVKDHMHPESIHFIRDTLSLFGQTDETELSYKAIQHSFNEYRGDVIERIDDRFLIQQHYLEQAQEVRNHNDVLVNIALCFQILGLIFVLSRGSL